MKYTAQNIREAEGLLTYQATHAGNPDVRARAKVTLALIELLDIEKIHWRDDLAKELVTKAEAGQLPGFDPDRPFALDFASTDDMLSRLIAGSSDGITIKEDFGKRF